MSVDYNCGVKGVSKRSKATFGRKALDIRYMLRTFTFMVKSQSSSEQSKMVPWCTNLHVAKDRWSCGIMHKSELFSKMMLHFV